MIHHYPTWDMPLDQFKEAVDSLIGFPEMLCKMRGIKASPAVGMTGGDPILSPNFEKMCEYLRSKFPKQYCGLWTTFPKGFEHYREIICQTFEHVFLNSHERPDIYHHPFLCAVEEIYPDKTEMWAKISQCPFQVAWSSAINPHGAFCCEMMGSFSMLFNENSGFPVEPRWWTRMPWDFKEQIEHYCPQCGGPARLKRRASIEKVDDVSPGNLERLRKIGSKKIERGEYVVSDLKEVEQQEPMAAYKDFHYRDGIARRYGLFLTISEYGYWTPHLTKQPDKFFERRPLIEVYKERWA